MTSYPQISGYWKTIYFHEMPSHESILEWYWGTGLRPYLAQLQETDHPIFEQELLERIKQTYPVQKNGTILFRFPRLFWIARKER